MAACFLVAFVVIVIAPNVLFVVCSSPSTCCIYTCCYCCPFSCCRPVSHYLCRTFSCYFCQLFSCRFCPLSSCCCCQLYFEISSYFVGRLLLISVRNLLAVFISHLLTVISHLLAIFVSCHFVMLAILLAVLVGCSSHSRHFYQCSNRFFPAVLNLVFPANDFQSRIDI